MLFGVTPGFCRRMWPAEMCFGRIMNLIVPKRAAGVPDIPHSAPA